MKSHILIVGALLSPALLANPGVRDTVTHEQLVARYQTADQANPMKRLSPSTGEDVSKVNQPQSLMSRSDVLAFNGHAALVPKRAILHIPEKMKDRMGIRDDVKLLPWAQFFAVNRGWIKTYEVSRPQAAGNVVLGDEILNQIGKGGDVIIATYQGGPISVLRLKEPEEEIKTNSN